MARNGLLELTQTSSTDSTANLAVRARFGSFLTHHSHPLYLHRVSKVSIQTSAPKPQPNPILPVDSRREVLKRRAQRVPCAKYRDEWFSSSPIHSREHSRYSARVHNTVPSSSAHAIAIYALPPCTPNSHGIGILKEQMKRAHRSSRRLNLRFLFLSLYSRSSGRFCSTLTERRERSGLSLMSRVSPGSHATRSHQ